MMNPREEEAVPLLVGMEVMRTPQGSLVRRNDVLLERTDSGRIRTFCPATIEGGQGVEIIDSQQSQPFAPRRLFDEESEGEGIDDLFEPSLAEALAVDSGSEADAEDLTLEELREILEDNDYDGEDAFDDINHDLHWSEDFTSFTGNPEDFREFVGPKIEGTSPSGLFTQLWDQNLIKSIAEETNRYAWQSIAACYESDQPGISQKSRLHQWVETSVEEIYRLISVMMFMSMCLRGRIDEYWSTGILGMPGFRCLMSCDRYLILMRFLHFVDNDTIPERGEERKVAKITPILNFLNKKFKSVYSPRREVSIDESLLLWKGRLSWVQCIRSKAARFGIKSYELCEAVTGYVLNIILYAGKGTTSSRPVFGFTSSTAKIVLELFKDYLGKGYCLFMDNFYNSISLTRFLKRKKTDVVGTLNRRRVDCPTEIKLLNDKRMPRGSVVSRHCGDVSVVAWKDVKLVTTVSTYHNADMAPGRRAGADCPKPTSVHTYNKFMGGVDLKDQKLSMYLLERKRGTKWYIKVFRRLLNTSILNAYVIYRANMGQQKKMTHRQFRYKLAEELCAQYGTNVSARTSHPDNPIIMRLDRALDHTPEHCEVAQERTGKQDRFKRGRCVRCTAKKINKKSNVMCSQCQVFLCLGSCWRDYHNLEIL